MLHRIRLALGERPETKMGGNGPTEVDETFIAPKPTAMHKDRRAKQESAYGRKPKAVVMGMLDRESRQVRARVVPNVKRETLQEEILSQIEKGSTVYTDGYPSYDTLTAQDYIHATVNHVNEYVRGQVHTQGIENFWSLLKRGLKGTYIAVEPFHLDRYIGEQVFRYNNRATRGNPINDADRFALAVSQIVGKRLTYAELTGKTGRDAAKAAELLSRFKSDRGKSSAFKLPFNAWPVSLATSSRSLKSLAQIARRRSVPASALRTTVHLAAAYFRSA